jgi:uncharacterized iron-regulated membrane protein
MTPETILLALRLLAAILLLVFVGVLFWSIRRDMALMATQVAARRRKHGQLVVISVEDLPIKVGATYPLLPITSFGRAPANTVHLPDTFASGRHALLTLRSGRWWLEDRASRNGTTLNGQLLDGPTVVSAGDLIGVGRVEFKVELE